MDFKARHRTLVKPSPHRHARYSTAGRKVIVKDKLRGPAWDGIARIFDFTGSLNPPARPLPPDVADRYAMGMDWKAVGGDLMTAIGKLAPDKASERCGSDMEVA